MAAVLLLSLLVAASSHAAGAMDARVAALTDSARAAPGTPAMSATSRASLSLLAVSVLPFNEHMRPKAAAGTPPEIADEKQRVPKPQPSGDKSRKDEKPKASSSDSDEDTSGGNDCFLDCLFNLFSSSSDKTEEVATPTPPPRRLTDGAPGDSSEPRPATMESETVPVIGPPGEEPTTPHWAAFSSFGTGWNVGPADVRREYNPALTLALDWFWPVAGGWQLDAGSGWSVAWGRPAFNYIKATPNDSTYDSPTISRMDQIHLSVRAGQYVPVFGRSTLFYWGAGPSIYWVHEQAGISYDVVKNGVVLTGGRRTDELTRVRPGADLVLGLAWRTSKHSHQHVGLHVRGYAIPWNSENKNSQTLDFIGDKTIVGINLGLALSSERF